MTIKSCGAGENKPLYARGNLDFRDEAILSITAIVRCGENGLIFRLISGKNSITDKTFETQSISDQVGPIYAIVEFISLQIYFQLIGNGPSSLE